MWCEYDFFSYWSTFTAIWQMTLHKPAGLTGLIGPYSVEKNEPNNNRATNQSDWNRNPGSHVVSFYCFPIVPSTMLCTWRNWVPRLLPPSALSLSSIKANPLISLPAWKGNQTAGANFLLRGGEGIAPAAWKENLRFAREMQVWLRW